MWQPLFQNRTEEEVPIGHITNGVHLPSWVAPQMQLLFDRHLGSLEAVGNVGVENLDGLNTTLKRLERFWIDQVRFRL